MITITEAAEGHISKLITEQRASQPEAVLRIGVMPGGCSGFNYSMNFDTQISDSDEVVEKDGFKVVIDRQSVMWLRGVTLDYYEGIEGSGFKFNNPNATSSCGCGKSFS